MLYKTRAIVLKSIRFKEADLITKLFTLEHGVLSFHCRGVLKNKKSNLKSALFMPFSILAIDYNFKEGKSLQYLKEAKQDFLLSTIHFEISKNATTTFLSEILNDIIQEKESDKKLFLFLENAIKFLDTNGKSPLFIHQFLISLTKLIGCPPNKNNNDLSYFDISTGCFTFNKIHNEYTISEPEIEIFKKLLGTKFDDIIRINSSKLVRKQLLYLLLKYYKFHVNGFKEPKSLTVLEEVFS